MRFVLAILIGLGMVATLATRLPSRRGALWRVVQACLVDHRLTGHAFPCLRVEVSNGADRGFAVLRAPLDRHHVILTPTVRTLGIEAPRLRGADAPNYFAAAWANRSFVTGSLSPPPPREALALAVNSRPGRSQDQLHIHVACIRPQIRMALAGAAANLKSESWSRLRVLPGTPVYDVRWIADDRLADTNLFDFVAAGLHVTPAAMDDVTIVTVGAPGGFYVMARKRIPHTYDEAHGEGLLDPACRDYR